MQTADLILVTTPLMGIYGWQAPPTVQSVLGIVKFTSQIRCYPN